MNGEIGIRGQNSDWKPGDPPDCFAMLLVGETVDERRANLKAYFRDAAGIDVDTGEGRIAGAYLLTLTCAYCGDYRNFRAFEDIPMEETICGCGRCYLVQTIDKLKKKED